MEKINEALLKLVSLSGDSEMYHSVFDDIIEERLMELDPDFMTALQEAYKKSGASHWCA